MFSCLTLYSSCLRGCYYYCCWRLPPNFEGVFHFLHSPNFEGVFHFLHSPNFEDVFHFLHSVLQICCKRSSHSIQFERPFCLSLTHFQSFSLLFYACIGSGLVDWPQKRFIYEEFWDVNLLMTLTEFDCPAVTLCGWQDIKIQLTLWKACMHFDALFACLPPPPPHKKKSPLFWCSLFLSPQKCSSVEPKTVCDVHVL